MNERERERSRERMIPEMKPEKEDELERGRKKVRDDDEKFTHKQSLTPRVEDWMRDGITGEEATIPEMNKRSYKDACGKDETLKYVSDEEEEWWRGDGWKSRIEVEMTKKGPNIIVSPEFKKKLAQKWTTSLIVRLLGRMVREDQLGRKLQQLWGRKGEVETIEIGSGFFLVRLSNKEDYDFALTGGPWLYMDHYLAVQPWKSEFDPDSGEVSRIAAWVRIPKFPVDFYDKGILYVVGSQIGQVLKVDTNTLKQTKGRFARICVEVDLSAPLLPSLMINGKEKKIVYEGLHLICFSCGRYGHDMEHCPNNQSTNTLKSSCTVTQTVPIDTTQSTAGSETDTGMYGEWMVAPRQRRGQRNLNTGNGNYGSESRRDVRSRNLGGGSRFEALNAESMEINDGDFTDSRNQGRTYVGSKQGVRLHVSKGKSKVDSGSDIINVGRNSTGQLNKLDKSSGNQAAKKKGIEEGTSKGILSRGPKIQQTKTQVDSYSRNTNQSKGAGPSSDSSTDMGLVVKNNLINHNPPVNNLGDSNPLDPGADGRENTNTQMDSLGHDQDVVMYGVEDGQQGRMSQ